MALQKQPIQINFSKGLDTKTDPKQVQVGNFLALQNSVFDKAGGLVKRNGYKNITKLPDASQTTLTTLNNNLLATGSNLYAYSKDTNQWLNQGIVQPVQLETQSLVRVSTSQSSPDMAIAANGLACLVYMDNNEAYYQISDSSTGQQIIPRVQLASASTNPRVFVLGRYFIITYLTDVSHLQYVAVPTAVPTAPLAPADISTTVKNLSAGYDAIVASDNLYLTWANTGGSMKTTYLSPSLIVQAPITIASRTADLVSLAYDVIDSYLYVTFYNDSTGKAYTAIYSLLLGAIKPVTQILTGVDLNQITSSAYDGVLTVIYENNNLYTYAPNAKSDYISKITLDPDLNPIATSTILRSVGLASKAFRYNNIIYMIAVYGEVNQPTYFLIDVDGNIYMKLAYSNGGGYGTNQVLTNVSILNDVYYAPYLIKDFLAPVNKETGLVTNTPVNAIYTQTGINLAKFSINTSGQYSSEIANTLHLTGGMLWQYDGVKPVEQGFHLYPENIAITTATTGGNITKGVYYYVFTYEWTDNQGNLHRSAPSIPVKVDLNDPLITTTNTNVNTINVPTLRLTYKVSPNPIRIVGYRWSAAQQTYYQFTSITSPYLNNPAIDNVTITDTLADSAILGQTLLYTTGGVIENIAAPASTASALFKNRLFLIDAEDQNLLWYSKQVIQNTPVEMSDLLTLYVAPTSGAQGSTGVIKALSAMDDKLIIFKKDAIYYVTGTGPDNTGANNDFSDPIFITSAVGCANPNSIVLMPNGLMFQSDKGIWLLGRDLSTNYIGAPVEQYNSEVVYSAKTIPATNQVRFVLGNRITLMYDYYYGQWGTFNNLSAISSSLYNSADTYLSNLGYIYQETDNFYLDGSTPVLLSFTTSWISLAGIQGLERFYELYILGTYKTPFKLQVQLSYDYNPSAIQSTIVTPDNYSPNWGNNPLWGSSGPWGGPGNVFETRVFPQQQKCETFQLTISEVYDPSLNIPAGEGLSLSGLNVIVGTKRGYRTQKASQSFG
jgi:hypothetical protein